MRTLSAGFRFLSRLLRRSFDNMIALVTAPLMTLVFLAIVRNAGRDELAPYAVLVFLAIVRNAGRDELAPYAVLAPALIALWAIRS